MRLDNAKYRLYPKKVHLPSWGLGLNPLALTHGELG